MVPGPELCLLDLPPDLLARIGAQLPFEERLQLSLVCTRLREVCAGPSAMWSSIDACICRGMGRHDSGRPFKPCVPEFASWFAARAQGVEELRVEIALPEDADVVQIDSLTLPADLLHDGSEPQQPLPLRKLAVYYWGFAWLGFSDGNVGPADWLPALQKVALFGAVLQLLPAADHRWPHQFPPRLTDMSLVGGNADLMLWPDAWLPPPLTSLMLSDSHVSVLPPALAQLRQLRSLVVDNNLLSTEAPTVPACELRLLTQLEELNLSCNPLGRPPLELTALRRLRILYLHKIVGGDVLPPPPEVWEPLRACTALAFLSISGNGLEALPPAVADMAHLRALHCEENDIVALPVAPYLSNLRELLADWRTLLAAPDFLRSAAQLSRLILHRFQPSLAGGAIHLAQPPGAGPALLAALAALPSLRRVDDVYEEGNSTHLVTAEMAHVMWQLGQRCPHLELTQPRSTNLGWTLSSLVAELPHNAGTAMLQE